MLKAKPSMRDTNEHMITISARRSDRYLLIVTDFSIDPTISFSSTKESPRPPSEVQRCSRFCALGETPRSCSEPGRGLR